MVGGAWLATVHGEVGVEGHITESDTTWQLNQISKTQKHIELALSFLFTLDPQCLGQGHLSVVE